MSKGTVLVSTLSFFMAGLTAAAEINYEQAAPQALKAGDLDRAKQLCSEWAEKKPNDERPYVLLGRAYLKTGMTDEALEQFGVREIRCEGQRFDPRLMQAVDVEVAQDMEDGAVLEVYRPGYTWNGEVLRPAQVKVARNVS